MPQSVKDSRELNDDEKRFVGKVERDNLSALTLDELAHRFDDIDQQAQLLQGRILLEARNRLGSDKEFGQWCSSHSICVGSQQHRNRLIHLAKFFETRELDKISISAAYEISAPINADIAVEIYEIARGKNMPLAEIRRQIAVKKGQVQTVFKAEPVEKIEENKHIPVITTENKDIEDVVQKAIEIMDDSIKNETNKIDLESRIMQVIENENPQVAIVALKNVIDELNKKRYGK